MGMQALENALAAIEEDSNQPVRALVSAVMELHREGLSALLQRLGPEGIAPLLDDATVAGLLVLHDLHPLSFEARVRRAVAACHDIELVAIDHSAVAVRAHDRIDLPMLAAHLPDANIHVIDDSL